MPSSDETVTPRKCCCRRINRAKVAYGLAALTVYTQGLWWLMYSLYITPRNCSNITTMCEALPQEYCGFACPTFIVFMVLIFGNIGASLPGILESVHNEHIDKNDYSYDSRLTLKIYSFTGIVLTGLLIYFMAWIYSLVTGCLYAFVITITREYWWKNKVVPTREEDTFDKV